MRKLTLIGKLILSAIGLYIFCGQHNVSAIGVILTGTGSLLRDLGQYHAATATYSAALRYIPNAPLVYGGRAYSELQSGRFDEASADYTKAMELEGPSAWRHSQLAGVHHAAKQIDLEVADWSEAIKLEPKNASHLLKRGEAYFAAKIFDKAIADFSEVIGRDPNRADAFRSRSNALKMSGDQAGMELDLDRALIIDCMQGYASNCDTPKIREAIARLDRASSGGKHTLQK